MKVRAEVQAAGVLLTLPQHGIRVLVTQEQAEQLRGVLGTVLPGQPDVEVLRAARAILEERGQDTENIGHALWTMGADEAGAAPRPASAGPAVYLLAIAGDVEPVLSGPYRDEQDRIEAAQDYRRAHGPEDGLYRVDADETGHVTVGTFSGAEVETWERRCVLCRCAATAVLHGCAVCAHHSTHGEDDAPCPKCARQYVAVGDRVQDPLDGTWREVMSIDPCGTVTMRDGGCMSVAECAAAEKRLPGESIDDPDAASREDGRQLLRELRDLPSEGLS